MASYELYGIDIAEIDYRHGGADPFSGPMLMGAMYAGAQRYRAHDNYRECMLPEPEVAHLNPDNEAAETTIMRWKGVTISAFDEDGRPLDTREGMSHRMVMFRAVREDGRPLDIEQELFVKTYVDDTKISLVESLTSSGQQRSRGSTSTSAPSHSHSPQTYINKEFQSIAAYDALQSNFTETLEQGGVDPGMAVPAKEEFMAELLDGSDIQSEVANAHAERMYRDAFVARVLPVLRERGHRTAPLGTQLRLGRMLLAHGYSGMTSNRITRLPLVP